MQFPVDGLCPGKLNPFDCDDFTEASGYNDVLTADVIFFNTNCGCCD